MQFLTECWYLSWCLPYSLTDFVPLYYDISINNAKINLGDSKKAQFTSLFPQNRDSFDPSLYEISQLFSTINFFVTIIYPSQVRLIKYVTLQYLWCSLRCRELLKRWRSAVSESSESEQSNTLKYVQMFTSKHGVIAEISIFGFILM